MVGNSLNVFMNGIKVGLLEKLRNGELSFIYDPQWLDTPDARPISLSLPLSSKSYQGDRVYNFFDNLLPDNDQIKARIQTLFKISSQQAFDLLASIGQDCVGAIQLCQDDEASEVKSIRAEKLDNHQISELLKNYQKSPLGMTSTLSEFRISISGAQEKTALLWKGNDWYRPLGTTPTTHIFKLPIGFIAHQGIDLHNSCENEWLCSKIAEAFNLPVAPMEIHHFEEVKVLVVTRFDRQLSSDGTWIMRLPQEDLCQALGYSPAFKYQADGGPGIEEIMKLLMSSEHAHTNRELFFRYQILFWLLAAIDGHAKNFSIFIHPTGRFELTPLYDVLSAYPLLKTKQLQKQKIKMAMALKGTHNHYFWHNIQRRHFLSTAKSSRFSVKLAEIILNDMLDRTDEVIAKISSQLPSDFPSAVAEPIITGLLSCRNRLSL